MKTAVLRLLALYVDFIIVNAIVGLLSFLLSDGFGYVTGEGIAWYSELAVSAFGVGLARKLGLAPGTKLEALWHDEARTGQRLWANLALGTFLILDGLKQAVRWMTFETTLPVFGIIDTAYSKVILVVVMGALYVLCGYLLLTFAPRAKILTSAALALSTSSILVSWPVLDEGIARAHTARRAAQGHPLREGEIEALQALSPYLIFGALAVLIVLLVLSRERREVSGVG